MGKLLIVLLVLLLTLLAAFTALAIWLYNSFGVAGFVGALAGLVVFLYVLKMLIVWGFKRLFLWPFRVKGAVLKDARLEVHAVTSADAPPLEPDVAPENEERWDDDELDDEEVAAGGAQPQAAGSLTPASSRTAAFTEDAGELAPQDWYLVEATITPRPPQGGFRLWEPGDLVLVDEHARGDDQSDDVGSVSDVEIWLDGRWQNDECYKYQGSQRLKLRVGLARGIRRARFKYYFEVFGDPVDFPAPIDV